MGLKNFFKPGDKGQKESDHAAPTTNEKVGSGGNSVEPSSRASVLSSRRVSAYPQGDWRNLEADQILDITCDVMVNHLYQQQQERLWTSTGPDEGIILKKSRGAYTCCPADIQAEPYGFFQGITSLNVRAAMTVNTRVIKLFLQNNESPNIYITKDLRLQVLPDMSSLPRCQKHQFAAFIADRGLLVVWDDDPRQLLHRAQGIESALMKLIWQEGNDEDMDEKDGIAVAVDELSSEGEDTEQGMVEKPRPIYFLTPLHSAATLCLSIVAISLGWKRVAVELAADGNYIRLAFILVVPLQLWLALFFFQALCGGVLQVFGPISQVHKNTKFYSGVKPRRIIRAPGELPHVTIQMPVYKEGLYAVIEPTIRSIKAAISTYEMQGGTANIFINDDGMQLVSEEDARARQDFYDEHNIGWVSRPKHNPKPQEGEEVFLRRGKFKKASNMNYAMWVSNRVEEILSGVARHPDWTVEDENAAYREALATVVEEDQGRTWADGNIRIGDYILIIDSDTRVPADCFLDAVSEMEQSPQVAIIQYSSGVMNVTDSFFEKGITFFTNLVYTQIRYAVANGDVAPFVGHNAVLRWSALQEIAYDCADDLREKFWSEVTVSEDFDMALRLQTKGYLVRLAAYAGDGFKEGVSLTIYDELSRWEKYAYGCNELVFHPLRYWPTRGPFTPLFRRFIASGMPLPSKLTIMAYVGTYYAIASAWLLTLLNYFVIGWYNGWYDHYYLESFKVYIGILIVFTGVGNIALAVLRYRTGEKSLLPALWECITWVLLFTVFFGGISLHVSQAILSHMFSIDMSWGATAKEAENTTFFAEVPKILKKFRGTFAFCILCTIMMIYLSHFAPTFWTIDVFIAIYPLSTIVFSHFMLPIVLNPGLMRFTW